MKDNYELKRQWQEKVMWVSGLALTLYFLEHSLSQSASNVRVILFSIYTLFFGWGAFIALTKPDVLIKDGNIYLFGRLTSTPLFFSLSEIQSIERHSETPIWRMPPLSFTLKDGRKISFSTGANESRMKRIMKFIETETAIQIKTT